MILPRGHASETNHDPARPRPGQTLQRSKPWHDTRPPTSRPESRRDWVLTSIRCWLDRALNPSILQQFSWQSGAARRPLALRSAYAAALPLARSRHALGSGASRAPCAIDAWVLGF